MCGQDGALRKCLADIFSEQAGWRTGSPAKLVSFYIHKTKKPLDNEKPFLCAGRTERKENVQWALLVNGPDGARIARQFRSISSKKTKKPQNDLRLLNYVRAKGLEPSHREALDPKSSVSTNFTTPAKFRIANIIIFAN